MSIPGEIKTIVRWIRDFVDSHPDYKHDSVVNEKINYDLMMAVNEISSSNNLEENFVGKSYNQKLIHCNSSGRNGITKEILNGLYKPKDQMPSSISDCSLPMNGDDCFCEPRCKHSKITNCSRDQENFCSHEDNCKIMTFVLMKITVKS